MGADAAALGALAVGCVLVSTAAGSVLPQKVRALGQMAQPESNTTQATDAPASWSLRKVRVRCGAIDRVDMGQCFLF